MRTALLEHSHPIYRTIWLMLLGLFPLLCRAADTTPANRCIEVSLLLEYAPEAAVSYDFDAALGDLSLSTNEAIELLTPGGWVLYTRGAAPTLSQALRQNIREAIPIQHNLLAHPEGGEAGWTYWDPAAHTLYRTTLSWMRCETLPDPLIIVATRTRIIPPRQDHPLAGPWSGAYTAYTATPEQPEPTKEFGQLNALFQADNEQLYFELTGSAAPCTGKALLIATNLTGLTTSPNPDSYAFIQATLQSNVLRGTLIQRENNQLTERRFYLKPTPAMQ